MKTLLALVGEDELSQEVLKKSIELAVEFRAKIIVLHTIHIPFLYLPNYNHDIPLDKELIKESIDKKIEELRGDVEVDYYTLVYFGERTERAILEANRDEVDMIVATSEIKMEKLISEVQKPLLVINRESRSYDKILIPVDLTPNSKRSIIYAKENFPQSKISLVYGYESIVMMTSMYDISFVDMVEYQEENRDISNRLMEAFKKEVGVEGELIDATSSLHTTLHDYIEQKNPDLVVVASGSKEGFNFGSVSAYIAREALCDVLIYC